MRDHVGLVNYLAESAVQASVCMQQWARGTGSEGQRKGEIKREREREKGGLGLCKRHQQLLINVDIYLPLYLVETCPAYLAGLLYLPPLLDLPSLVKSYLQQHTHYIIQR